MIKITAQEHIKTKGDFKLDGLWVKNFHFNNPSNNTDKATLLIEVIPYATLDDGTKVFDLTRSKKVHLLDVDDYLKNSGDMTFLQAYFATEGAVAKLLSDRTEWTASFEAPQA